MTQKLTPEGHTCRDAYMLYYYECVGQSKPMLLHGKMTNKIIKQPCGHREVIWNSRDGVVPFGATCPSCGEEMRHTHWHLDRYAKDYKLHLYQKYWADMTEETARELAKRTIERATAYAKDHPDQPIPSEGELVRHYLGEFGGHPPALYVNLVRPK